MEDGEMRRRYLAAIALLLTAGALWSCYVEPVQQVGQPTGYVYAPAPWVAGPPPAQVLVLQEPGFEMRDRHEAVRGEIWRREQDRRWRDGQARIEGERGRPGSFGGDADRGMDEGQGRGGPHAGRAD
jgi:hypothetical protein